MSSRLVVALSVLCVAGAGLAGCGGKRRDAAAQASQTLAEQPPVLPAMVAQVYASGASSPADPVVALAAGDRPLDEALSGAAAALALEHDGGFTLLDARWAAWRAGYPFAVRAAVVGESALDAGPVLPAAIAEGLAQLVQPGDDVGLARARTGPADAWVALVATPVPGVPGFSRQYTLGDSIQLALTDQARWSLVSPEGERQDGQGPVVARLQADGEWWLDAQLPGGRLAVPLYVDLDMPPAPLLDLPGPGVDGPASAVDLALTMLGEVRRAFDLAPLATDPTLQTLAQGPLEQVVEGSWQHAAQVERLRGAGFLGGSADQAWCQGRSVALCLEGLLRTADGRVALLAAGHRLVGVAARVESDGITLVINLASE